MRTNKSSTLSKLIRNETYKILEKRLAENKEAVVRYKIRTEIKNMLKEAEERAPKIQEKLEKMRKELIESGELNAYNRGSLYYAESAARPEKRIPLYNVSKVIDIPVNELILHFLNGHRIHEGNELVEYRIGHVYFYGDVAETVK